LLDESGRQTLGAAVLAAATPAAGVAGAGDPVERPGLALDPGDHLLDRTARHELDEDEVDEQDPEERGDDQQEPAEDIGAHLLRPVPFQNAPAARSSAARSASYHQKSTSPIA